MYYAPNEVWNKLYDNRIIRISGEINNEMASDICSTMLAMDDDNHNPITLYIDSPGGEVNGGLQIIDTINTLQSPVFTINVAMCASMAAVILSAGAKRMSLPHARVMIHQVSSGMQGNIQDMMINLEETKHLNDVVMNILAENCNKKLNDIKNDTVRDRWLYPEDAIQYGIIDGITGNKKRKVYKEGGTES